MTGRWSRPGRRRQVVVGDVTVTYLPDGYVEMHPGRWFARAQPVPDLDPRLLASGGMLVASVGVLLLEGPGWRLLVDAGLGPTTVPADRTHPALGAMVGGGLARHAAEIGTVDAVLVTHAHDDHAGWARQGWPGFPGVAGAPHLVGEGELAPASWRRLAGGEEVVPGVSVLATPGHTAGHLCVVVSSGTDRVVVLGDVLHSPLQIAHPDLGSCFESDPAQSIASRSRALRELAVPGTVGAATHFADVPFERLRGHRWEPVG